MAKRNLYYSKKSRITYIAKRGGATFVTHDGHVGETIMLANTIVGGNGVGTTYENAEQTTLAELKKRVSKTVLAAIKSARG